MGGVSKGPARPHHLDENYLRSRYVDSCWSVKDIAFESGVSISLVNTRLHELGLNNAGRSTVLPVAPQGRLAALTDSYLYQAYTREVRSAVDIAVLHQVPVGSVVDLFDRFHRPVVERSPLGAWEVYQMVVAHGGDMVRLSESSRRSGRLIQEKTWRRMAASLGYNQRTQPVSYHAGDTQGA